MVEAMFPPYKPNEIEPKWQKAWEEAGLYTASEAGEKPKYYCLDFFPYPSGEGLHVGHCRNYIPTDVISRYKRMRGYNVLHPMGWDAFGEPTENAAIQRGIHPRESTAQNTANFRRQMTLIGCSYDWSREITSSDPSYYHWTQWFFLLLYRRGLAYRDMNWQWWCPVCQTTLSSHEAAGGVCWRGHEGITRRQIPAWYFKISGYADELISGLDEIDWPESIKTMQRNWIGRSEGWEVDFEIAGLLEENRLPVFTTRPDTLAGVTFLVLAPEHPLVSRLTAPERREAVAAYVAETARRSEVERMVETRAKSGVFTGALAVNPFNGELVPVWIADYVLPSYGTGAVMGVPAHDERDLEFARQYDLPVKVAVAPPGWSGEPLERAYTEPGRMVNSGIFDGLESGAAIEQIGESLAARGQARWTVQYRMRDWLISRQRYWGTPIPIVYCERCGEVPVPEEQLPVLLPEMLDFRPDGSGRSPLARLPEFVHTACPSCGGAAQRETDTMGGFACSSWYFLRFNSPHYSAGPFLPEAMRYWMPVDLYVGGAEHAVLHLLYARFWTKVMADAGLLDFREPFSSLLNQGQLMGLDGHRMSKSRGNVITPDSVVAQYGADALRVYSLFMAPFDQDIGWSTEGINGAQRFLYRVWGLVSDTYFKSASATGEDPQLERLLQRTVRRVSERIETFRFNTMVSALMEFVNALVERHRSESWCTATFQQALDTLLVMLAPAAPTLAEELWQLSGHSGSVHSQPWPAWDENLAAEEMLSVAVQVDGKLRAVIEAAPESGQAEVEQLAFAHPKVKPFLEGRSVGRVVYVPGKRLSVVTKG